MNCVVLHESSKRLRMRVPLIKMSYREADLLEYYICSIEGVKDASVDERTGNVVVTFIGNVSKYKKTLTEALAKYDSGDEKVKALVPEVTGREVNRRYQEKLVVQVAKHLLFKFIMPTPISRIRTAIKGAIYVYNGIRALCTGKLKVETLDAIAIAASIIRNDYDTAGSIMFLLDTGETLEEWTRKKSVGDLARSMSLGVEKVWVEAEGAQIQVDINSVKVGDRIVVRNSDIIPLDGKVVRGEMTVNQATMTGESEPVVKGEGSYVYAGTVVEEGECLVEVAKESGAGKYDQIVRMIEESEKLKSKTEAKAYRLADSLVPFSLIGFGLTYLITRNATKAMSFLMVDYSCAMKLSMPLSVLSAIRESRDHGIAVKGGKFMEAVAEADTIIFDKTGTLTNAVPKLVDIVTFGDNNSDEMLRISACLEEHYPHSIANAIVNEALVRGLKHDELHDKVEYVVAHGVSSYIGEKKAVIGSYHFVMEDEKCQIPNGEETKLDLIKDEYSRIYLAIDGVLVAVLCIFDPVRDEAEHVLNELRGLGIKRICMMTGDNKKTAAAVAKKLGLDDYYAEVLPEDKALYVKKARSEGHKVIMVGDGVNDTPALSEANVGVAIDDGAAIAREVADITISSETLEQLVTLRKLSMALMKRINNNYRFIIGFNSTLIALGVTGIMSPSSSALLHNGSTILTGVNSMTDLLDEDSSNPKS